MLNHIAEVPTNIMQVSVVIPVYNAEMYVEQAVLSALDQPEVAEVLLVEDGSPDDALMVCKQLTSEHDQVKLFRHRNGANLGAAASRNLGILNASNEFIAFLDADDFYLANRFKEAKRILANPSVEAVFEATGTEFESPAAEKQWAAINGPLITTVRSGTPCDRIFEEHGPVGKAGHCHLNGLTVRRATVRLIGMFAPELTIGEDTDFFLKLTACGKIRLGNVNSPVAMRRVHASNRVTEIRSPDRTWENRLSYWLSALKWIRRTKPTGFEQYSKIIVGKIRCDARSFRPGRSSIIRYFIAVYRCPRLLAYHGFLIGILKQVINR